MSNLTIFKDDTGLFQVRVIEVNGEPWFVAKDACEILELSNPTVAVERLDDDEVSKFNLGGLSGEINIVSESGLYSLVLGSRKPEAKSFKRWITHEVIPQIRKTGVYVAPTVDSSTLYQIAKAMEEKERQIALLKPKADFFDAVADSKSAIEMSQAAKVLSFGKGRNTLFKILREEGILRDNNEPYQEYIDRGYFRVIEQKFKKPTGETEINIKTLVYQRGLDYIRKVLDKRKAV